MKELVKDPTIALSKTPLDQKANKKNDTCFPIYNMWVFLIVSK